MFYILDENNQPRPIDTAQWSGAQTLKSTTVNGVTVVTIFNGVNPAQLTVPALFETQVISSHNKVLRYPYFTWREAIAGHETAVQQYSGG